MITADPISLDELTEQAELLTRVDRKYLLTAQDAAASARGFLGSLPAVTRQAHVLVGTVIDDPDAGRTADELRDADAAYRAASAERAVRDAAVVSAAIVRYWPPYSKPMAVGKNPAALNRCSSECGLKYEQCS